LPRNYDSRRFALILLIYKSDFMHEQIHVRFVKYSYLISGFLGTAYIFHRLAPAIVAVDIMRDLRTGGVQPGLKEMTASVK
jgi:hypothetical protein